MNREAGGFVNHAVRIMSSSNPIYLCRTKYKTRGPVGPFFQNLNVIEFLAMKLTIDQYSTTILCYKSQLKWRMQESEFSVFRKLRQLKVSHAQCTDEEYTLQENFTQY